MYSDEDASPTAAQVLGLQVWCRCCGSTGTIPGSGAGRDAAPSRGERQLGWLVCHLGQHVLVGSIKGWVFTAILPLHQLRDTPGRSSRQDPASGLSPRWWARSMGCSLGTL